MSQIVTEVHHFVVNAGDNIPVPTNLELAAEAQRLAQGGHIVSMTVPGGNVVEVAPFEDAAEIADRFGKALPAVKKEPVAADIAAHNVAAAAQVKADQARVAEAKAATEKAAKAKSEEDEKVWAEQQQASERAAWDAHRAQLASENLSPQPINQPAMMPQSGAAHAP